jgi:hypothetical protein
MPHALPNELEAPVFTALFHRESTPRCPLFRLWDHFSSISAFNKVLSRCVFLIRPKQRGEPKTSLDTLLVRAGLLISG